VNALAVSQLQGLIWALPSDPVVCGGSVELSGLPVSEVGLTTRNTGEPKVSSQAVKKIK